jgi:PIN domain nuclease of toxin-antitoxin system
VSAVVSDTHALIWFSGRSSRLSAAARAAMEAAEISGQPIYVPAIVVVEMRYLVEKGAITETDYTRILAALRDPATALTVKGLDLDLADAASQIPRSTVPDMPDRIIAATALGLGLPLVTRDHKIRALTNIATIW